MQGRRITLEQFWDRDYRQPGDYAGPVTGDGATGSVWYIVDPFDHVGRLVQHTVTEHDDGTITVEPSILDDAPSGWHGYLERGVWRQV